MHNLMFPRYELRDIEMSAWGSLPVHAPQAAAVPARQDAVVAREYILTVLMEEGGEVVQAAAKCLRFGWDRNQPGYGVNHEVLAKEVGDLLGVADALGLDAALIEQSRHTKMDRVLVARQDAVPDEKNVVHIGSLGEPETRALTDTELDLICRGLQIASQGAAKSMASELQRTRAQTAVGEGELPELRTNARQREQYLIDKSKEFRFASWDHSFVESLIVDVDTLLAKAREAIAQRDEANDRRIKVTLKYALTDADVPADLIPGQEPLERVQSYIEQLEAKLAAATEFKPDELSGLETCARSAEISGNLVYVNPKLVLKLLRSIPSEPAGNRKAAENAR